MTTAFAETLPSEYGFIILDREFVHWPLFHDDAAWKLFCYLLMRANYTARFWGHFQIDIGQFVTSYDHLAQDLHKSHDQIKHLLTKLKKIGEITTSRLGNALLITLPNYLRYMQIKTPAKTRRARPAPELAPQVTALISVTKENNPDNPLIRKENFYPHERGLQSLGQILGRCSPRYHFDLFPPEKDEVEAYIKDKQLSVNLPLFWEHYTDTDWCDKKGRKLAGWHFALHKMSKEDKFL